MVKVELIGFKINGLEILNNITESGLIKLGNTSDFEVQFDEKCGSACAVMKQTIEMVDKPENFHLDMEVQGMFQIDGIKSMADKKKAHSRCYDEMFPYANHIIKVLSVDLGMPLCISKQPMELGSVRVGSKPDKKGNGGKIIEMK